MCRRTNSKTDKCIRLRTHRLQRLAAAVQQQQGQAHICRRLQGRSGTDSLSLPSPTEAKHWPFIVDFSIIATQPRECGHYEIGHTTWHDVPHSNECFTVFPAAPRVLARQSERGAQRKPQHDGLFDACTVHAKFPAAITRLPTDLISSFKSRISCFSLLMTKVGSTSSFTITCNTTGRWHSTKVVHANWGKTAWLTVTRCQCRGTSGRAARAGQL